MKNICLLIITAFFANKIYAQQAVQIIPQPVTVVEKSGVFTLPENIVIQANADAETAATLFAAQVKNATGYAIRFDKNAANPAIKLSVLSTVDTILGAEGYRLSVNKTKVTIVANKPAGIFYGLQSLLQLFPAAIVSKTPVAKTAFTASCVDITDYPKLGWRGLMFDVTRHFFTIAEVKQFIDNMVGYKFNLLHLHLTDDEGWRIEINGLPNLTKTGAWRVNKTGSFGTFSPPIDSEPRDYGGFYTQADIKELIAYAAERFVNILPEIDVPGHSLAAIASYPELSCTPDAVNYHVRSGEPIMDWSHGAPPLALVDNTLCPANEKVYVFLDTVISQIARLFPFPYIHMGGDEAPHNFWEKTDAIKQLMEREGLTTIPQVQAYFEKRVEKIVQSKGKKMMGWDEIMDGGISPTAAVMSWRGMKYGIRAANEQHNVVMSPTEFAYLDYMQADVVTEPKVYASLRLNKTYQFNPVPAGVDPKYVIGAQANLWTEQVYNIRQAEYMLWPRAFAIAESIWTPDDLKDWNKFVTRTETHFKRLDMAETKHSNAIYDPSITVSRNTASQLIATLTTEISGLDIYYSFDNSEPDRFYPKYTGALTVPKDAILLKLITYRDNKPIGRMISFPIDLLQKRIK